MEAYNIWHIIFDLHRLETHYLKLISIVKSENYYYFHLLFIHTYFSNIYLFEIPVS